MKPVPQVFATKLLDFALRFTSSVLIARYLGPTDKGVLTFATLVVAWVTSFGNFSLADATVYLVGRGDFPTRDVTAATFTFSTLAGFLYVGVTLSLVYFGFVEWPVGNPAALYLLLSLIPLQLLAGNFTSILQGLKHFKAFNAFTLLNSALFLVMVLAAVWVAQNRLMGVVYAMIFSAIANTVVLLVYLSKVAAWRPHLSLAFLKKGFHYGLRSHGSVILETINRRLDQLVLGAMVSPIQLGWYSIAVSISELPQLLPDSIGMVLFPRVAANQPDASAVTARACRTTVLAMLIATAVLMAAAGPLIRIVFGEAFLPAAKPLLVLAPGIVFLGISKILTKYICGVGRPQIVVLSTLASALVTLGLIFPLISRYGMLGAAITSTVAYAVGALFNLIFAVRLSAGHTWDFLIARKLDLQLSDFR